MELKFFDLVVQEENTVDVDDIKKIEKGQDCILIILKDGFILETNELNFS